MTTTYYESAQAIVTWDELLQVSVLTWKSFAKGDQYRIPMVKVMEQMMEHSGMKILFDTRHISAISPDDQQWGAEEWLPRLAGSGVKFVSTITPEKMVAGSSLNRAVAVLGDLPYTLVTSKSLDEAKEWLAKEQ